MINARVWGGFPFRSANLVGARMGRKLGHWIGTRYFQPVSRHPSRN